jgi:hypothetical protein
MVFHYPTGGFGEVQNKMRRIALVGWFATVIARPKTYQTLPVELPDADIIARRHKA